MFGDEAGIKLEPTPGRIWSLKGRQPLIPSRTDRRKVNVAGYVNPLTGKIFVFRADKGNAENFIKQLEEIRKFYLRKKVTLYVDNARWHHAKSVNEWLKKHENFKLKFIPPYSPELNPIERHWWYLRKRATQNKLFENEDECWNKINRHFETLSKKQIKIICKIY